MLYLFIDTQLIFNGGLKNYSQVLLFGWRPAGTYCYQGDEEEDASCGKDDIEGTSSWQNMQNYS